MRFIFFNLLSAWVALLVCQPVQAQDGVKKVILEFLDTHPSVLSNKAQVESAQKDIDASKWSFYPTPSFGYETADQLPFGALDKSNKYFRLQQPVWTAGRLSAQLNKSEAQYFASEFTLTEQKLNVVLKWLQLWSEYQMAEEKIKIYQDSESKHLKYFRQIERRAAEGYSAPSDVQLSLSRLNSVQADLRQVQSAKKTTESRLEQMLKKPLSAVMASLQDSGWPPNKKAISGWFQPIELGRLEDYVNIHPTVQKSRIMISMAEADVTLAGARNLPEVYLRSEWRQGDITGSHRSMYIGLSSSFGAGLSNLSAVEAAQAKVQAYQNDMATRQMEVQETIQTDLQNFQAQFDRLGQLESTYAANHLYLESSERQYLAGRRSWQEIMNIAREESQILAQISEAKAQVWLLHQRLQILGSGLETYLSQRTGSATAVKK